jgi:large subunit ribosomal protein L1
MRIGLLKKIHYAKFNETVELHMRLGVDPKHADQMVRGTVLLPTGSEPRRRFASLLRRKAQGSRSRGADVVGGEDLVEKINGGWTDFDACIATPDMMRSVGKLGKVLGHAA